jgi:hypothetical protein
MTCIPHPKISTHTSTVYIIPRVWLNPQRPFTTGGNPDTGKLNDKSVKLRVTFKLYVLLVRNIHNVKYKSDVSGQSLCRYRWSLLGQVKPTGRKYLWYPMVPQYTYEPCRHPRGTPAGRAGAYRVFSDHGFLSELASLWVFRTYLQGIEKNKNVCKYIYQYNSSWISGSALGQRANVHMCTAVLRKCTHILAVLGKKCTH